MRDGDNEHVQGFQEVVVVANKIDRAEKDAKQIENKVRKKTDYLFFPQTLKFNNPSIKFVCNDTQMLR